jgi:chemotaxis protein methyltransferase CheR
MIEKAVAMMMMTGVKPIGELEFQQVQRVVEDLCGISLSEGKGYLVESRLMPLLKRYECKNYLELMNMLKGPKATELKREIINAMTTRETLWVRDKTPYSLLEEVILPDLADPSRGGSNTPVRIWSAACSTGQEPYSIAMVTQEFCTKHGKYSLINGLQIHATDISEAAITQAKKGVYDRMAMSRGLPPQYRDKYFKEVDNMQCELTSQIRRMVTFQQLNLMDAFEPVVGQFDVIFIRNVAIYFSLEVKQRLFKKIARCLKPNGYLLLGSTESLNGVVDDFKPVNWRSLVYYRHPGAKPAPGVDAVAGHQEVETHRPIIRPAFEPLSTSSRHESSAVSPLETGLKKPVLPSTPLPAQKSTSHPVHPPSAPRPGTRHH